MNDEGQDQVAGAEPTEDVVEVGSEEEVTVEETPEADAPVEENSWDLGTPVAAGFEECESCSA